MSASDPFDWVGATLEGKVRIDEVVGEGGFGVVYRGHHLAFDEPVAVKCLKVPASLVGAEREKFHRTFLEEGRLLHRLSRATAGIVQALDMGAATSPGGTWTPYLVLEWLHGSSLDIDLAARRSRGEGGRSLADAIALLEPAARALDAAHAQGVAHRDIKPANLFLARIADRRTLKVLDFGIAKVLGDVASVTQALAETGGSVKAFTPQYGAPEQFNRRFGATGPWTDVYALTLVLVELCSGKAALDGGDTTQLYIVSTDTTHRPTLRASGVEVPDAVEEVVKKALTVDPRDRYRTAGQLWDALLAALPLDIAAAARVSSEPARTQPEPPARLTPELESMPTAQFLDERDAATAPNLPEPATKPVSSTGATEPTSQRSRAALAATEPVPRSPATTGPVLIASEPAERTLPVAAEPMARRRGPGIWIGGAIAAVVVLGGLWMTLSVRPPPPPPPAETVAAALPAPPSASALEAPPPAPSTASGRAALEPPNWGAPSPAQIVPVVPALDRAPSIEHATLIGWAQGAFGYCQDPPADGSPRICLFRKADGTTPVIDVDKNKPTLGPVPWPYGEELFLTWTIAPGSDKKQPVLRIGARVRGEPGAYPIVIGGSKTAHKDVHPEAIALSPDGQAVGAIGHAHGEGVKDELYVHVVATRELAGRAFNDAGFAHHKKGEYERAAELFHKATFADPQHPNAAYNLACAYARLGDARAEAALARAFERDPETVKRKAASDADLASVRGQPWFVAMIGAAPAPAPAPEAAKRSSVSGPANAESRPGSGPEKAPQKPQRRSGD